MENNKKVTAINVKETDEYTTIEIIPKESHCREIYEAIIYAIGSQVVLNSKAVNIDSVAIVNDKRVLIDIKK